jgi:ribosome-associated heat shock protein Hsp15
MWLWCARFLRSRSDCAKLASEGRIRINRQPTDKPHARLRVGDVLTVPLGSNVRVVRILALAERRGPAVEAVRLYTIVEAADEAREPRLPCVGGQSTAYRRS